MIETSGERDISGLDPRVVRVVDVKCPGSGESERNRWSNLEHLTQRDELKFVVSDRRDYEWARDVIRTHRLSERVNAVLLSPVFGKLEASDLAAWTPRRSINSADAVADAQAHLVAHRPRRVITSAVHHPSRPLIWVLTLIVAGFRLGCSGNGCPITK